MKQIILEKRITKALNEIIQECLGGPRGDLDEVHMTAAAIAYGALKSCNLRINHSEETCEVLQEYLDANK